MTLNQYEQEFPTVSGSSERVEYVTKLPGADDDGYVYLPIDPKFPSEDYYRLENAHESGDKEQIELYRKSLLNSIKRFAKDIDKKHLNPPETTDLGTVLSPTEDLYSEVVRNASFFDSSQCDENIVVAGPSASSALLDPLAIDFETLGIQKNTNGINKILGNAGVKFEEFGNMLVKAQKQINTTNNTLDSLISARTNTIIRALNIVESYQDRATVSLLGLLPLEDEENHGN